MAKSIKLGNDTYLDASGVVVDSAGTTLADSIGWSSIPLSASSATMLNCTGTLSFNGVSFRINPAGTRFEIFIRGRITNFVRSGSNPGFSIQTTARPKAAHQVYVGAHTTGGSDTYLVPETCIITLSTTGLFSLQMTESFANLTNGTVYFSVPLTQFGSI